MRGLSPLALESRAREQIDNDYCEDDCTVGMELESQGYVAKFPSPCRHRPTKPTNRYNCHGMTFASRRSAIIHPEQVRKILNQDGYIRIDKAHVVPGDIIIYPTEEGDVEHSGLVLAAEGLSIVVVSKWGRSHEVIHPFNVSPYDARYVEFWRIVE